MSTAYPQYSAGRPEANLSALACCINAFAQRALRLRFAVECRVLRWNGGWSSLGRAALLVLSSRLNHYRYVVVSFRIQVLLLDKIARWQGLAWAPATTVLLGVAYLGTLRAYGVLMLWLTGREDDRVAGIAAVLVSSLCFPSK